MPCVRGARTLSEGATFCPHCGLPVAASSLPFISDRSRTQSHPISSTSDSKEAISAGYAGFVFQEFSVPQVPTFPAQPGVPAASPLLSLSGVSVAQKLGGRSTGYTVLSILLAITLIFVGLGIALYVIGSHWTAVSEANKLTAMRLYDQITSQRPAVEETLTNPQAATWVVNAACTLTKNDGLHVYSSETNYFRYCEDFTNDYINFAFQVQMQVLSGDAGGLVFRVDDSSGSLYAFVVSPTGLYRVWILKPGADHAEDLTMGTTQAVYPESVQADTLAVIAQGAIFDFYINRQFVTQVQDATLQRGYLGVLASDETQATEVVYTNEQIWDVG